MEDAWEIIKKEILVFLEKKEEISFLRSLNLPSDYLVNNKEKLVDFASSNLLETNKRKIYIDLIKNSDSFSEFIILQEFFYQSRIFFKKLSK